MFEIVTRLEVTKQRGPTRGVQYWTEGKKRTKERH